MQQAFQPKRRIQRPPLPVLRTKIGTPCIPHRLLIVCRGLVSADSLGLRNVSLRTLDLYSCGFGDTGATSMAVAIASNKYLEILDIGSNQIHAGTDLRFNKAFLQHLGAHDAVD